jgi:serine/threonine protein kinase
MEPELTDYVATRWYRSPELLLVSDNMPYGKEVDIWAIGCIMGELMDGQPLFPGDSEVDQLYVIQKVLGPLPKCLHEKLCGNTRYQGLKFPKIAHPETLEVRYAPVMNEIEIDLMKKLLEMDPYQRITASEALNHEFFDELQVLGNIKNSQFNNVNKHQIVQNTQDAQNNRIGSINSNPGSTASRGSKYNIHQSNQMMNMHQMQNS